ncbi:YgjP-like metallopeptidase domain-containing protein [Streptomyces luteireticuli]|uniref:YgjP-like metallopeptidase domain-containing protein n=1 Tax=Streptomyces luteireticuli TaxID=173858 RepID=UPI003557E6AE
MIAHTPTIERTIQVGDMAVTLRTGNRRTRALSVTSAGAIVVHAPHGTSNATAIDLVKRRREWIYRQIAQRTYDRANHPVKELVNGETFLLLGTTYLLHLAPPGPHPEPTVQHHASDDGPRLRISNTLARNPVKARRELIAWYANQAQEWLDSTGRQNVQLGIRQCPTLRASSRATTRWATYRPGRGLVLHWAVAQLAEENLHTLIAESLHLNHLGDLHQLHRSCKELWLGKILQIGPSRSA